MAKKKKEMEDKTDFLRWKKRIEFAKEYADQANKRRGFSRFIDYYRGNYEKQLGLSGIQPVIVNEVYSYVKTSMANLYIQDPYITVNPVKGEDVVPALVQEQVVNNDWRRLKLKLEVKKSIQEVELVGRSFIKIGYEAIGNPQEGYIDYEDIWGVHVPWDHVLYDPQAIDPPYDCRWMVHWYKKSVEFMNNKYPGKNIRATSTLENKTNRLEMSKEDTDFCLVYEIWDRDSGYRFLYCDGYDGWLEKDAPVEKGCIGKYKIGGFPIYMLKFDYQMGKDDNFPISSIEMIEPQILEKIKLRSMELNHIKRHSRQMGITKGSLTEAEKDKFVKGIDGGVIEFESSSPIDAQMKPIQYAQMQPEIYAIEDRIDIDRDKISGQSQLEQGAPVATKSRTLGEIQQITRGTGNRKVEKIDVIEDFCEAIAKGLIGLERQFYDTPRYAQLIGDMNDPLMQQFINFLQIKGKYNGISIQFNKEDIRGDYSLEIRMGSTIPLNKENRISMITQAIRFGQFLGLGPGTNASNALGRMFFRDIDMPEIDAAYQQDLADMQAAKEQGPSPQEQLQMAKQQQDLERGQSDKELKDVRVQKNKLDILKKAVEMSIGKTG